MTLRFWVFLGTIIIVFWICHVELKPRKSPFQTTQKSKERISLQLGKKIPRDKNPWDGWWVDDGEPKELLYDSKNCADPRQVCQASRTEHINQYRWIPSSAFPFPSFPPFGGGKDLIECLDGRDMLMIGDSMIRNLYDSLMCQLSNPSWRKRITYKETHFLCQTTFRSADNKTENVYPKGPPQIDNLSKYSIVLMNTAAWYSVPQFHNGSTIAYCRNPEHNKPCDKMTVALPRCYSFLRDYIKSNSHSHPTTLFVWKASSARHNTCKDSTELIPAAQSKETDHYRDQETIFSPLIQLPNFLYFDVNIMSQYRRDAHPARDTNVTDCRHWCLPGIPDVWARMLQQHFCYFSQHNHRTVFSPSGD